MTHVTARSESSESMFAIMANPEKVDMTRPRPVTSLAGLRFPGNPQGHTEANVDVGVPSPRSSHSPSHGHTPLASAKRSCFSDNSKSPARHQFGLQVQTPQSSRRKFFEDSKNDTFSPSEGRVVSHTMMEENGVDDDPYKNMSASELQFEKQSTLMELDRLHTEHGCKLSREYTMRDNLADMKFEVRCHLSKIDETSTVKFMSDGMKLMCQGVELANNRWGPFLDLDGWASAVTDDMSKYESSLAKLYRKYWKRSTMAPELELAFGIIGSIALHHFKRKAAGAMFGGESKSMPTNGTAPQGGRDTMPFSSMAANPRAPVASFSVAPPTLAPTSPLRQPVAEEDDEEEEPPSAESIVEPLVPESVPLSARKRLIFN